MDISTIDHNVATMAYRQLSVNLERSAGDVLAKLCTEFAEVLDCPYVNIDTQRPKPATQQPAVRAQISNAQSLRDSAVITIDLRIQHTSVDFGTNPVQDAATLLIDFTNTAAPINEPAHHFSSIMRVSPLTADVLSMAITNATRQGLATMCS